MPSTANFFRRSKGKSVKEEEGPKENKIVKYRGVSMVFLKKMRDDVVAMRIAKDVELVEFTDACEGSYKGKTVQLWKGLTARVKRHLENGRTRYRAQGIGIFDLPADSSICPKPRNKWSVEDICEFVVLEETRDEKTFYLNLMDEKYVGKPFEGAFLSQARKSCFSDLIDSLLMFYEGKDLSKQFIWFDMFCANQPLLTTRDEDLPKEIQESRENLLKEGLHSAIKQFDQRLIYFNSWLNPYPIQRAWCVWEIFGCVKSERSLEILFHPNEEEVFMETLLQDREEVTKQIMKLRLDKAQCFSETDKLRIDSAVKKEIGYHKLNVMISNLVLSWLRKFADKAIAKKRAEVKKHDETTDDEYLDFAWRLLEAGIFFRDQLADHEHAFDLLKESMDIFESIDGTVSSTVANVLFELGGVYLFWNDFEYALTLFELVLAVREDHDEENVATTIHNIGSTLRAMGKYDLALEKFEAVLEMERQSERGKEEGRSAATLNNIAGILQDKGDYTTALQYYRETLSIQERKFGGESHPDIAATRNNIAAVFFLQGDVESTLLEYERVICIQEQAYGGRNHPVIATTLSNMAQVLHLKGDYDGALHHYVEALKIERTAFYGMSHSSIATTLNNIACVYKDKREFGRALKFYKECLKMEEEIHGGSDHPSVATTLQNIGCVYRETDELETALWYFKKALRIAEQAHGGRDHLNIASILRNIGSISQEKGEFDEALRLYTEVLAIQERLCDDRNNVAIGMTLHSIASTLQEQMKYAEALKRYEEVLEIWQAVYGEDSTHPNVETTLSNYRAVQTALA